MRLILVSTLVWLVFIIFSESVESYGKWTPSACGNRQFRKNRLDEYKFQSITESGIAGTTNNKTVLETTATVKIYNWQLCDFILEVNIESVVEKNADNVAYNLPAMQMNKLKFRMENGMVSKIEPSAKSLNTDELNIQRAILSLIQIRQGDWKEESSWDDDVSGKCLTEYKRHTNGHGLVRDDKQHIDKSKNLATCKHHQISHSNIDGQPINQEKNNSPLLKSKSLCSYTLNRKRKVGLQKVSCSEEFMVQAFSSSDKAGAYVRTNVSMIRMKSNRLKEKAKDPYRASYLTNIHYVHNHQHLYERVPHYKERVETLLTTLANQHYEESQSNSAESFFDMVMSLRHLSEKDIFLILGSFDPTKENYRSFMFDALAQCGTIECVSVFQKTILQQNYLPPHAMSSLAFIKEPSEKIIRLLIELYDKFHDPSTILTMSSLVYKMCNHMGGGCENGQLYSQTFEDVGRFIRRILGKNCQTTDTMKQKKIFHALKAIGNIGKMFELESIVLDCIRSAPINISIAAIEAYRRTELTPEAVELFTEILIKENEDMEKRASIFLMMMKNPVKDYIKLAIDLSNSDEKSSQLRSFIYSYLMAASKFQNKHQQLFQEVLSYGQLKRYNPPATRFSKAFMHHLDLYWFSGAMEESLIFHPESFVPRSVNVNLTAHIFGFAINAFELNARMEGLEQIIGKIFGEKGHFSKSHLKKVFSAPHTNPQRKRRSVFEEIPIIDEVNMKHADPYGLFSVKVFGNEIDMYDLKEIPILNGEFEEANIFKQLYEFTMGKQKTFKRNMILLEASHYVPTIIGMPLKITVNSSAITTLNVNGKLKVPSVLYGLKDASLEGFIQPSVSIYGSAKLSFKFPRTTEIGTKFRCTAHTSKKYEGSIRYKEQEDFEIKLKADPTVTDLFNISYDMIYVTKHQNIPLKGVEKVAKGRFCTDQVFNSTTLLGSNMCVDVQFPNAYYNSTVPYFPLTGPLRLGVRNYPTDPSVTHYQLQIKKNEHNYSITVSTPNASNERKYQVALLFQEQGSQDITGIYFGENNKGILLSYKLNNETNEFDVNIASNYTEVPLKLQSSFFNRTDPATLNRFVGGNFYFLLGKYHINKTIYYENMYQYWAFGSITEYMPGRFAYTYAKISYENQHFLFNFTHPSTSTKIFLETVPTLPLLQATLNITHNGEVIMAGNGILDLPKYEGEASGRIDPLKHKYKAIAKWLADKKFFSLKGSLNKIPFTLNSSLAYNDGKNIIQTNLTSNKLNFNGDVFWNENSVKITTNNGKQESVLSLAYSMNENGLELHMDADIDGETAYGKLSVKNSTDSHAYCFDGENPDEDELFGYCLIYYHTEMKHGIEIETYTSFEFDEGEFEKSTLYPLKIFQEQQPNKISYIFESMSMVEIRVFHHLDKNSLQMKGSFLRKNIDMEFQGTDKTLFKIILASEDQQPWSYSLHYEHVPLDNQILFEMKSNQDGKLAFLCDVAMKNNEMQAGVYFNINDTIFKMIVKNVDSLDAKFNTIQPNVTLTYDRERLRWKSLEYVMDDYNLNFKLLDRSSYEQDEYVLCGNYGNNENCDDISKFYYNDNGIEFIINTENEIINKAKQIVENEMKKSMLDENMNDIFNNVSEIFKAEEKYETKNYFKNIAKDYLLNLNCNGDKIYKKYIKGKIDMNLFKNILQILTRVPNMIKGKSANKKITNIVEKINNVMQGKPVGEGIQELFKVMLSNETKIMKVVKKSFDQGKLNLLQREYLLYLQEVSSLVMSEYLSEEGETLENVQKFTEKFPFQVKSMLQNIILKLIRNLREWKYNPKLNVTGNVILFIETLQKGRIQDLFSLDYNSLIIERFIERFGLPQLLKKALVEFSADLNYYTLASRLTRFYLSEYKAEKNYAKNFDKLMNSASLQNYIKTLVDIAITDGDISQSRKSKLKVFLEKGDIKPVVNDFVDHICVEKYKMTKENADKMRQLFLNFDFKAWKHYKGFASLIVSDTVPALLGVLTQEIKLSELEKTIASLIKHIKQENNILVAVYKAAMKNGKFSKTFFENIFKVIGEKISIKDESIRFKQFTSVFMKMFTSNSRQRLNMMKSIIKEHINKLPIIIDEYLPTNNTKIAFKNVKEVILRNIKLLKQDVWEENATNAVMDLLKNVFMESGENIVEYSERHMLDDIKQVFYMYASLIEIGEEKGLQMYNRIANRMNERLMFLIRLMNQFSLGYANTFSEWFVENGQIDYYGIYKSLWTNQVANEKNKNEVKALYNGLEKRALDEIKKYSGGDFSVVNFVSKIINYVKSLNYTDINAAIEGYEKIQFHNFEKITSQSLLRYLKVILNDIGEMGEDDISINKKVREFLPHFHDMMAEIHLKLNKITTNQPKGFHLAKQYIRKGFWTAQDYLNESRSKQEGLVSFLLNILVPGLDGLIEQIEKKNRIDESEMVPIVNGTKYESVSRARRSLSEEVSNVTYTIDTKVVSKKEFDNNKLQQIRCVQKDYKDGSFELSCDQAMINSSYGFVDYIPYRKMNYSMRKDLCFTVFASQGLNAFEKDTDKLYSNYKQNFSDSSTCKIINFVKFVKTAKKDEEFIFKLLDYIESIVLQNLDESFENQRKFFLLIGDTSGRLQSFASNNSQATLQTFVFNITGELYNALRKSETFLVIEKLIQRSLVVNNINIESMLTDYIAKHITKIAPKGSMGKVNKNFMKYVNNATMTTRKYLQNTSIKILEGLDEIKKPLLKYEFLTDPLEYLKSIPRTLVTQLQNAFLKYESELRSNAYKFEKDIVELQKKFSKRFEMLKKHNGTLPSASSNKALSEFLHALDKKVSLFTDDIEDLVVEKPGVKMQTILYDLSRVSAKLKQKANMMKETFVNEALQNITQAIKTNENMINSVKVSIRQSDKQNNLSNKIEQVTRVLQQNVSSLLEKHMLPQVQILFKMIDDVICDIKRNISQFYSIESGKHKLFFGNEELKNSFKNYKKGEKFYGQLIKNMIRNATNQIAGYSEMMNYNAMGNYMETIVDKQLSSILDDTTFAFEKQDKALATYFNILQNYTSQRLDHIIEKHSANYPRYLQLLATKINENLSFKPPTDMEVPIIKFLGIAYKESKEIFKPISRTAYIFENSIVTFDGKVVYLPKLSKKQRKCKLLLAYDTLSRNFSMFLQDNVFRVFLKDARIDVMMYPRYEDWRVSVFSMSPPRTDVIFKREFPSQLSDTTVVRLSDSVKIESVFGITIYCKIKTFACNISISGYYHNKSLGLFGTNNVETSDDLRMPNGKIASTASEFIEFLNSYQLDKSRKCRFRYSPSLFGGDDVIRQRNSRKNICRALVHLDGHENSHSDAEYRARTFTSVCTNEKSTCSVHEQYISSQMSENQMGIDQHFSCSKCDGNVTQLKYSSIFQTPCRKPIIHIFLLVKLIRPLLMKDYILRLLSKVEKKLPMYEFQHTVVGFGGDRVRYEPHIATGDRKPVMNLKQLSAAIKELQFSGKVNQERLGLSAIKYAANLDFGMMSSKIFLLFDNDVSYNTNSLREMMQAYDALSDKSITLNVVNSYKMRRRMIGKDSYGNLYSANSPTIRRIRKVRFPPADDYIPLVKQTGGAVFSRQTFYNSQRKWMRSSPTALAHALKLQIESDLKKCKSCICGVKCRNVPCQPEFWNRA